MPFSFTDAKCWKELEIAFGFCPEYYTLFQNNMVSFELSTKYGDKKMQLLLTKISHELSFFDWFLFLLLCIWYIAWQDTNLLCAASFNLIILRAGSPTSKPRFGHSINLIVPTENPVTCVHEREIRRYCILHFSRTLQQRAAEKGRTFVNFITFSYWADSACIDEHFALWPLYLFMHHAKMLNVCVERLHYVNVSEC